MFIFSSSSLGLLLFSPWKEDPDAWTVGLYVNDVTPSFTSKLEDFTPAGWPGYVSVKLGPWSPPFTLDSRTAAMLSSIATFEAPPPGPTPGTLLYGYYVLASPSGYVGAERFAGAPLRPPPGRGVVTQVRVLLPLRQG